MDPLETLDAAGLEPETTTTTPTPTGAAAPATPAEPVVEGEEPLPAEEGEAEDYSSDFASPEDLEDDETATEAGDAAGAAADDQAAVDAGAEAAAGEVEELEPAPAPQANAAAERAARRTAMQQVQARIKTLRAELKTAKGDDYDPYLHGPKQNELLDLQADYQELQDAELAVLQAAENKRTVKQTEDDFWAKRAAEDPVVGARTRTIFEEELSKAKKRFSGQSAIDVATVEWERRINVIKGKATQKAGAAAATAPQLPNRPAGGKAKPAGPANRGRPSGGQSVLPRGMGGVLPKKRISAEDSFALQVGDGVKSLVN